MEFIIEIKDGAYLINLDEYSNMGTHLIALHAFGVQAYDSVISGYFCIGFVGFMLKGKTLADFTNLFSSSNFHNNIYPNLNSLSLSAIPLNAVPLNHQ